MSFLKTVVFAFFIAVMAITIFFLVYKDSQPSPDPLVRCENIFSKCVETSPASHCLDAYEFCVTTHSDQAKEI